MDVPMTQEQCLRVQELRRIGAGPLGFDAARWGEGLAVSLGAATVARLEAAARAAQPVRLVASFATLDADGTYSLGTYHAHP